MDYLGGSTLITWVPIHSGRDRKDVREPRHEESLTSIAVFKDGGKGPRKKKGKRKNLHICTHYDSLSNNLFPLYR